MIRAFSTRAIYPLVRFLDWASPLGDLLARVWVAYIFFMAGLLKYQTWDATLHAFHHEYAVSFLPPFFAAVLATGAELILPILLLLGLGGRLSIVIFFLYNLIAMFSYPHLWTPEGAMGLAQHISWGLLLALLMFHGPGKLSLDYFIRSSYQRRLEREDMAQMRRVAELEKTRRKVS